MPAPEARNSAFFLVIRGTWVLVLTAVAVAVAFATLWYGLLIAPVFLIGALFALPTRPAASLACLGYALVLPYWTMLILGPVTTMLGLLGVAAVAVGLWYALPGRWVCPDCRSVVIRLPNVKTARCPVCSRVSCLGSVSRCPDCGRFGCRHGTLDRFAPLEGTSAVRAPH